MKTSEERLQGVNVQKPNLASPARNNKTKTNAMNSVLIVDDEAGIRSFLQKGLDSRFGLIEVAEDVDTANELRNRCHFDLIIADIRLPGRSGVEWVTDLREQGSMTEVIFITAFADIETAIAQLEAEAGEPNQAHHPAQDREPRIRRLPRV